MADIVPRSEMNNDPADIHASVGGTFNINKVDPLELVTDAYTSFGGFRNGKYLVEHTRESEFEKRQGYTYYINLFKPVVDSLVDPLFKRDPGRDCDNDMYQKFLENCDRNGNSFTQFMKRLAIKAKVHGIAFLVMDNLREQPISKAEAEKGRIMPYVYMKLAKHVVFWEINKFGELISIAFEEDAENTTNDGKVKKQYRKWTKDGWQVYAKLEKGELKDPTDDNGTLKFSKLPVLPLFAADPEENELIPNPPLYDIAALNAGIYNLSSELRAVMRSQGFNMLTLPVMGGNPPKDMEVGLDNILPFPHDSKHRPDVLTFDPSVMDPYFKERETLIKQIFQQAKLAGVSGQVEQKTGVAKAWDFQATDTVLSNYARDLEKVERLTAELFGKWINAKVKIKISYPEDFGVVDVDEDINKHERLTDQGMPPEVIKASKKQLVRNYFADMEPDEVQALVNAVENMADDEIQGNAKDKDKDKPGVNEGNE